MPTKLINLFTTSNNVTLVVLTKAIVLLSNNGLKNLMLTEIDPKIKRILSCFAKDHATHGNGFLLSSAFLPDSVENKNVYQGGNWPNADYWLVKCKFNLQDLSIELSNPTVNSVLLKKENVRAILEYALNKMLVHVSPKDLLIFHDWECVKLISEPSIGNIQKHWLCPFGDFDVESFPFVVTSGGESFSLVNVKTFHQQVFCDTQAKYVYCAQGSFFRKEKHGFSFHFANFFINKENERHESWIRMELKPDYIACLQEHGRIPETTIGGYLNEIARSSTAESNLEVANMKNAEL